MTYVYLRSEPRLWTVGYYDPSGKWQPESDYSTAAEAAARTVLMNGGDTNVIGLLEVIDRMIGYYSSAHKFQPEKLDYYINQLRNARNAFIDEVTA